MQSHPADEYTPEREDFVGRLITQLGIDAIEKTGDDLDCAIWCSLQRSSELVGTVLTMVHTCLSERLQNAKDGWPAIGLIGLL